MADGLALDLTFTDTLSGAFERAIAAGADLTPAMGDIAGHLADETRERFETQEGPDLVPWLPSHRAEKEGGRTLTLTGDLVNSIAEDFGPDYAAAGPEASGGAAVYAAIHQFGGTIRPREKKALAFNGRVVASVVIPARPYLGWTDADSEYAVAAIGDHLARSFGDDGAAA